MRSKKIAPRHPGEILLEEFLKPMGISQNRWALDIRVPARRINEIVQGNCHKLLVERYGYRILNYYITPDGKCPSCSSTIPGIWW